MEDVPALYSFFKRTELQPIGPLSNEALIERLGELEQVLCIVNTKKHASDLYEALKDENTFCLTTLMYPLHRTTALSDIKGRLKDGLPCRVIATSLVEAGVDFDFPTVYRAEAGLDSIIQAAGRCEPGRKTPGGGEHCLCFPAGGGLSKQPGLFCNAERRCTLCDPALLPTSPPQRQSTAI